MSDAFSNVSRASRFAALARAAMDLYEDEPPALLIENFADARHWCDAHDHPFAELDRLAYGHYLQELHAERGQDGR